MSKRPDEVGPDGDNPDEVELIRAEFDSIVAGLSLDESSPRTYLDDLDAIEKSEKFTPPRIAKQSLRQQLHSAKDAIKRWRRNNSSEFPDDGAQI